MRSTVCMAAVCVIAGVAFTSASAGQQTAPAPQAPAPAAAPAPEDPIKTMVGRLDLEKYKATIKGLTQFGDRRQGTERNRKAIDWIEAQLKSYGLHQHRAHHLHLHAARGRSRPWARRRGGRSGDRRTGGAGGGRRRDAADAARPIRPRGRAAARSAASARGPASTATAPMQPDEKLRALEYRADARRPRRAPGGLLHEGRHHAPGGDVHRRRPHGRHRLGRGGERRRVGHGDRDGAGAHLQQPGRADRALDPLRALEQRGDGHSTARAPTSTSGRRCRGRKIRRARASIRSRSGSG